MKHRTAITIWIALILVSANALIIFAHNWINPDTVFVGTIGMIMPPIVAHIASTSNNDHKPSSEP